MAKSLPLLQPPAPSSPFSRQPLYQSLPESLCRYQQFSFIFPVFVCPSVSPFPPPASGCWTVSGGGYGRLPGLCGEVVQSWVKRQLHQWETLLLAVQQQNSGRGSKEPKVARSLSLGCRSCCLGHVMPPSLHFFTKGHTAGDGISCLQGLCWFPAPTVIFLTP